MVRRHGLAWSMPTWCVCRIPLNVWCSRSYKRDLQWSHLRTVAHDYIWCSLRPIMSCASNMMRVFEFIRLFSKTYSDFGGSRAHLIWPFTSIFSRFRWPFALLVHASVLCEKKCDVYLHVAPLWQASDRSPYIVAFSDLFYSQKQLVQRILYHRCSNAPHESKTRSTRLFLMYRLRCGALCALRACSREHGSTDTWHVIVSFLCWPKLAILMWRRTSILIPTTSYFLQLWVHLSSRPSCVCRTK